jgi:hypothetical protein
MQRRIPLPDGTADDFVKAVIPKPSSGRYLLVAGSLDPLGGSQTSCIKPIICPHIGNANLPRAMYRVLNAPTIEFRPFPSPQLRMFE